MKQRTLPDAPVAPAQLSAFSARERAKLSRQLLREASGELARLRRIRGAYRRTWRRIARARARLALVTALLGTSFAEPALAGAPVFRPPGLPVLGDSANSYASPEFADIDGDGDFDAYVGGTDDHNQGYTAFVENVGTPAAPAFAAPVAVTHVDRSFVAAALADIDGDGDLDLFTGTGNGDTYLFENVGTPSAPSFRTLGAPNPYGLVQVARGGRSRDFADVDGDGDLDLFAHDFTGDTIFFANTGTANAPAFAPASTNPFGLANVHYGAQLELADIDGDGDLDAFVSEGSLYGFARLIFFENTGTATAPAFAPPATGPFGLSDVVGTSVDPAFVDIDGDGDLDAFLGQHDGSSIHFENTGTAVAPAFARSDLPMAAVGVAWPVSHYGSGPSPDFADIDGDGDLDAFVGDWFGETFFLENTGSAVLPDFAPRMPNPFGIPNVRFRASPALADIDGDGDLDALVGTGYGTTILFRNTGSASAPGFASPATNPFGLADVGYDATPAFADLDGDGDLDAVVGNRQGNAIFFENTGTASAPGFAAASTNPFGLAAVPMRASPAFADVDGDGDLDGFIGERSGRITFFANTGTASAPAFIVASTDPFGFVDAGVEVSPTFADLDGDGDLDGFIGTGVGWIFSVENLEIDPEACTDGIDNDGDGRIDLGSDPGCASAADTSERGTTQCDNGLDDDGDGRVDFRPDGTGDAECVGPLDDREAPTAPGPGCGLGPELAALVPLLAALRRRRVWRA